MNKIEWIQTIRTNIERHGYHVTVVQSGLQPRFAYTIGLNELLGFELIFAGGVYFDHDQLIEVFYSIVEQLRLDPLKIEQGIAAKNFSGFTFSNVDNSWSKVLMPGVFDYYKIEQVKAFQIIPHKNYFTVDIPDMTTLFNAGTNPIWQWLVKEWNFEVPKESTVVTNLDALFGHAITEVSRWELDNWEMFSGAGPDVEQEDMRIVSLGIILGIDESVAAALQLEIGAGIWRASAEDSWHDWEKSESM